MPLPKSMRINRATYKIKETKELHRINPEGKRYDLYGLIGHSEGTMELEEAQPKWNKQTTLMHEAIHGMLHQTPLAIEEYEELVCLALAPILVDFIQQNPQIIEYLKEKK